MNEKERRLWEPVSGEDVIPVEILSKKRDVARVRVVSESGHWPKEVERRIRVVPWTQLSEVA